MVILSDSMAGLLNAQVVREANASNAYKALAVWSGQAGYFGAAKWLNAASADETSHRDKVLQYLVDMDAPAITPATDEPQRVFAALADVFAFALQLERDITAYIQAIYKAAMIEGDYMTMEFLNWFVAEQRASLGELLDIMRIFQAYGADVAMIDTAIRMLAEK